VLALSDDEIADRLDEWRERQSASVAEYPMDDL
jgi:5-(carboxyamino)imidazole ribonucleotide mutase